MDAERCERRVGERGREVQGKKERGRDGGRRCEREGEVEGGRDRWREGEKQREREK